MKTATAAAENIPTAPVESSSTPGIEHSKFVDAPSLLLLIFDEKCRPTVRWLRDQVSKRSIPFTRVGRLVFFDPALVRQHLSDRAKKTVRGGLS